MVLFQFEIENFVMSYKMKSKETVHQIVQLIGILGGSYSILRFLKYFLEDGVMGVAFKRRIGKLD